MLKEKPLGSGWGEKGGWRNWADVEQCPRLRGVFSIPSPQDIPAMLFFQFVNFLSKGFNVRIFLFQV